MEFFAETSDLTNSENLAFMYMALTALITIPTIFGIIFTRRHALTMARKSFKVFLGLFLINLAVFTAQNGFLSNDSDENLIDKEDSIYLAQIGILAISSFGLLSTSLIIIIRKIRHITPHDLFEQPKDK